MGSTVFLPDVAVREHEIEVPVSREDASLGKISVFCRELSADDSLPAIAYFQGCLLYTSDAADE